MTSIMPPSPDAPFDEKLRFYRGLARISPEVVSGPELKAMALRWLRENDPHHNSPLSHSNRKKTRRK
jgi:hypothetical protein